MDTNALRLRESIRLLERKLGILAESNLACCQLTLAQCHALVEIGRACCISLVDLANTLNLDNSTLSRTVAKLEKRGLCARRIDPANRRYLQITLTKRGRAYFEQIELNMNAYYEQVLTRIPPERHVQMVDDLSVLIGAIADTPCCSLEPEKEG